MWVSKSRVLEVKAAQLRPRAQRDFCADSRTHYQTQLNGSRHCIDVTAEGFCISSLLSACFQKLNTHKVPRTGKNVENMTPDNVYKDYMGERDIWLTLPFLLQLGKPQPKKQGLHPNQEFYGAMRAGVGESER